MRRGVADFDYGLSDDDDLPARRPSVSGRRQSRDESIGEMLSERDAAMMFGGGGSRRGGHSFFDMSGGGDLIDAAVSNYSRRGSAMPQMSPQTMMTDEDQDFDLEFQKTIQSSLGIGGFHDAYDAASGRRSESPAVPPSVNGSNGSMDELLGDIMDDEPKKPSTSRSRSAPSSAAEDVARTAPRRLASPGVGSVADSRGSGTPLPPQDVDRPALGKDLFDVELKVQPRRSLAKPKPKASKDKAIVPMHSGMDSGTPSVQEDAALTPGREGLGGFNDAASGRRSVSPAMPLRSESPAAPPSVNGSNDSMGEDDLDMPGLDDAPTKTPIAPSRTPPSSLAEETAPRRLASPIVGSGVNSRVPPVAPTPPPEASYGSDPRENSGEGLPDFLLDRNRAPRRSQANMASAPARSMGFDLGFAEEDLEKSDQSGPFGTSPVAAKPMSPVPTKQTQDTERLGVGTGLLDVPLEVKPRRSLAKPPPKTTKDGPTVPLNLGMDSAPPSVQGDIVPTSGLPRPDVPRAYQLPDGLPPGSPLTQTAQSESGSLQARGRPESLPAHRPEILHANAYRNETLAGTAHANPQMASSNAFNAPVMSSAPPPGSMVRKAVAAESGDVGSPGGSDPNLSLFGPEPGHYDLGGRAFGGFSEFPPLAAAPSQDLLSKLAYSEAKVRHLQLQLEDSELRMRERLDSVKKQHESELEKMELQSRRLEAELERCKEIHKGDLEHLNTSKQLLLQNFDMEKDEIRREERRKAQLDLEKAKIDHDNELEELRRRHERNLSIVKQQAEMEADNLKRAQSGEHQLTKLVEQVQGSVAEVERMSRRVDTDKSLEWSVRERQLEAREKQVRDYESRLSAQSKEVEDQRRRVSELVRHMESSQVDDRESLKLERERLQDEHARLLALQQSVREADRNNKEALKHAWAQLEDERHGFKQDQLRFESDAQAQRDEAELVERQQRQETERLKAIHQQVEVARQNASRRIRETEATIASERRALMSELEVFEEKRRNFVAEWQQLEDGKNRLEEDRIGFEQEVKSVGLMAAEVERRSEELKSLHDQASEARSQILRLKDQLHDERNAQLSEEGRLKSMQTLVEQQRLQLLQTENQLRVRAIEDIDLLVTTQFTTTNGNNGLDGLGESARHSIWNRSPYSKADQMVRMIPLTHLGA